MNQLVRDFYRTDSKEALHSVIFLTDGAISWEEANQKTSTLPRGWYELCQLTSTDRIEFVQGFWLSLLPYHPIFHQFLSDFFEKLDDVGVVLSQSKKEAPWVAEMIYSLKDNRSFFRGLPPGQESDLEELRSFLDHLPFDYLSFLRIHNGFGRLSEMGLLQSDQVVEAKTHLMDQLLVSEPVLKVGEQVIDPSSLIPFYDYGLGSYQCFFADWYPVNEMGNVYLSGIDYTLSNYMDRKEWADQLAFPTFLEWLTFYLEGNSLE